MATTIRAPIALANARVIDGTGAPVRDRLTVVLDGGRIALIDDAPAPFGATVIDVEGATLLPGLIDVHVHMSSVGVRPSDPRHTAALAEAGRAFLRGGVTTVRDLGAYGDSLFAYRARLASGLAAGPRLVL